MEISLNLEKETEKKFKKILGQYTDNERFIQNIIAHEVLELKRGIVNMKMDLKDFEEKYNMSSVEFYQKFDCGQLGDDEDFMIWAGIYEMLLRSKERLAELQ